MYFNKPYYVFALLYVNVVPGLQLDILNTLFIHGGAAGCYVLSAH